MKQLIVLSVFSLLFISCGGGSYVVKQYGDDAEIVTTNDLRVIGEFIALTDDSIILLGKEGKEQAGKIVSVKVPAIKSIRVKGYSDKDWRPTVILTQIVPAVALGVTAATVTDGGQGVGIAALLSIPAVITYLLYDAASPDPPRWDNTLEVSQIKELGMYARMPQGITELQLQELLKNLNQKSVIELRGR